MPTDKPRRVPTYRLHKNSGRALTTIAGRDYFLGRYGSPASFQKYEQLKRQWLTYGVITPTTAPPDLTIVELLTRFWEHADRHYPPTPGSRTSELDNYRHALRPLRRLYGETRAADFGPMELMLVRDEMIAAGWCRNYVNRQIGRLKHVFKWAAKFRLVPASVREGLAAVEALRPHRSPAGETKPVTPVAEDRVVAVLDHLAPPLRAMVELQALTGARSGELCIMRTIDVDTSGAVWIYRPSTHKTAHRGHAREIRIGPRAQAVLRPFLKPDLQAFVFSPAESESWRRDQRRETRRSRLTPSQIRGRRKPIRAAGRRGSGTRRRATAAPWPGRASLRLRCPRSIGGGRRTQRSVERKRHFFGKHGTASTCGIHTSCATPRRRDGGATMGRTWRSCCWAIGRHD